MAWGDQGKKAAPSQAEDLQVAAHQHLRQRQQLPPLLLLPLLMLVA
jgi:hypothetical protein